MRTFLNKLLLSDLDFKDNDLSNKYKFIFLNNVLLFASIVALGMSFIRWKESYILGIIDVAFSFIGFSLVCFLRYHKQKIELISTISLILFFILFFIIYIMAPYNQNRISLFLLLSASAFFLKGRKKGMVWMAFIIIAVIIGHYIPSFNTGYHYIDLLTTCLYLLGLYFVFDNYEVIQEKQTEYLENLNVALEHKVIERTQELREVNKALELEKLSLKNISSKDQLTGLFNRYKLEDLFEFEKKQVLRYNTKLSLIIMDIDFFKLINDTQGHNAGDYVLKETAKLLIDSVRTGDVVVRWGGEEFVILTPKTTLEQATHLAEKLRENIKNHQFPLWPQKITASFGVTEYKKNDSLEKMIQHADIAMYLAKNEGRDKVKSYSEN